MKTSVLLVLAFAAAVGAVLFQTSKSPTAGRHSIAPVSLIAGNLDQQTGPIGTESHTITKLPPENSPGSERIRLGKLAPKEILSREQDLKEREKALSQREKQVDEYITRLEDIRSRLQPDADGHTLNSEARERCQSRRALETAMQNYLMAKSHYENDVRSSARSWFKYPLETVIYSNVGWQFAPRPHSPDPYASDQMFREMRVLLYQIEDYLRYSDNPQESARLQIWHQKLSELLPSGVPSPEQATPMPGRKPILPGLESRPDGLDKLFLKLFFQ